MTAKKLFALCSVLGMFVFSSYAQLPVGTQNGEWTLRWEDYFNQSELSDAWFITTGAQGGGNRELQFYTDREENVRLGYSPDGRNVLILEARRESFGTGGSHRYFTSGTVRSRFGGTRGGGGVRPEPHYTGMAFQYGKLEIRAWIPRTADGLWPALWLMGADYTSVGWPRSGEIDLMEMGHSSAITGSHRGMQEYRFGNHFHWGYLRGGGWPNWGLMRNHPTSLQAGFNLWTMIWCRREIRMYIDRDTQTNPVPTIIFNIEHARPGEYWDAGHYFHKPFFILMNVAVGGTFTGIDWNLGHSVAQERITALNAENNQSARMYIDYVRVWQRGEPGERFIRRGVDQLPTNINEIHASQVFSVFPNPVVGELHIHGNETPEAIAVFNILGTRVLEVQNTNVVDMSSLPAGNYILQITRTNGSTEIHRVSKAQ